jgi:hypothetical protein
MPEMIASRAAACAARCCGFPAVADEIMAKQLGRKPPLDYSGCRPAEIVATSAQS